MIQRTWKSICSWYKIETEGWKNSTIHLCFVSQTVLLWNLSKSRELWVYHRPNFKVLDLLTFTPSFQIFKSPQTKAIRSGFNGKWYSTRFSIHKVPSCSELPSYKYQGYTPCTSNGYWIGTSVDVNMMVPGATGRLPEDQFDNSSEMWWTQFCFSISMSIHTELIQHFEDCYKNCIKARGSTDCAYYHLHVSAGSWKNCQYFSTVSGFVANSNFLGASLDCGFRLDSKRESWKSNTSYVYVVVAIFGPLPK